MTLIIIHIISTMHKICMYNCALQLILLEHIDNVLKIRKRTDHPALVWFIVEFTYK